MSVSDELFQGCSEQGELMSPGLQKSAVMAGALHASSHIWIVRKVGDSIEVMLQLRAHDKSTWPGYWDISAAGHVDFGETPLEAAKRETLEEIGVRLIDSSLKLLFTRRDLLKFDGLIENEFRWVYLYDWQHDTRTELQDGEVAELQWVALSEFVKMTQNPDVNKLVDQGRDYFGSLVGYLMAHENN